MDAPKVEEPTAILASAQAPLAQEAEARSPVTAPKREPASAPTPSTPQQPVDRTVLFQAFRLLKQNKLPGDVCAELQKGGVDAATAASIVEAVDKFINVLRAAYRKEGLKIAGVGGLLAIAGILLAAIFGKAGDREIFGIAGVAVLFGFIRMIRGLVISLRQPSEDDVSHLISALCDRLARQQAPG